MNHETILIIACVIMLYLLYKCWNKSGRESFLPPGSHTGTWDDWDSYAKDYGTSRAYWGQMLPGGGWSGSPYAPNNNPSGVWTEGPVGYPASFQDESQPYVRQSNVRSARPITQPDLAHAKGDELEYLWKSQLMESSYT
jgi:hypothetical protein